MKILITGASGAIGKFLTKKLKDHDVFTPTSAAVDFSSKDHVDYFFEHNNSFDIIIHCAVKGGSRLVKDGWSVMDTTLKMYYNLLEHQDKYKKFITFGSGAEIYMHNEPYGLGKRVIANSMSDKEKFYNIRVYGLFGEGELDTRFIKASLQNYINKQSIQINENKFMDFFYMEDLWTLVRYYMDTPNPPKEVDCSYSEDKRSLKAIASIINTLGEHKVEIVAPAFDLFKSAKKYVGDAATLESLQLELIGFEKGIKLEYEKYKLFN